MCLPVRWTVATFQCIGFFERKTVGKFPMTTFFIKEERVYVRGLNDVSMTRMYMPSIQDEHRVSLFLCNFSKNRLLPKKIIIIMNNKDPKMFGKRH